MKSLKYISILVVLISQAQIAWSQSSSSMIEKMDINLRIRASEDPNFDKYLIERQREKALERKVAVESKKQKMEAQAKYQEVQKKFAKKHKILKKQEQAEALKVRKEYYKKQRAEFQKERKQRKKFAKQRVQKRNQERKEQQLLIAKMQNRLSRLPASSEILQRKRVPHEERQRLYRRILEDKQPR